MGGAGGEREADAWQACSAECTAIPARSFTRQSRHNTLPIPRERGRGWGN